tara:strand:+ start:802 stop:1059 length:258 start_codon:yes stop_codon:yes gene_type:complete
MVQENSKGVFIYERIELESFPSCDDYKGEPTKVFEDDLAVVLRFVGRPMSIGIDPRWFEYDVYEIFIRGAVRQIFRQNIVGDYDT